MTKYIINKYLNSGCKNGRRKAGILLSLLGMALNLLLFVLKTTAGGISGSIAITADGFNNLADTGSCILALLGFKLGDKQPDEKYPSGYGRYEYISGLLISAAILVIGCKMLISSVKKIVLPEPVEGSAAVAAILVISIITKGYMYIYNNKIGIIIRSPGMRAAAMDSLSDCIATIAILASVIIESLTGINADGYTGVLVAICIICAGITSVKESAAPLLGKAPDRDLSNKLEEIIKAYPQIHEVYDIKLHDYGPHKKLLTFFISADEPVRVTEELIKEIYDTLGAETVICPVQKNPNRKYKNQMIDQQY